MGKKVNLLLLAGVLIIGLSYFTSAASHNEESVVKDRSASLGSDNNPYTVLEVVPDEAYAEFGYLIGGEEPVDLNAFMTDNLNGTTAVETAKSIINTVSGTSTIQGVQEVAYNMVKQPYIVSVNATDIDKSNIADYDAESQISLDGYFVNVGAQNGDYNAEIGPSSSVPTYMAKSWDKEGGSYTYNYVYLSDAIKDKVKYTGYAMIDTLYRQDTYRIDDNKNFHSYNDDIANMIPVKKYDYAYKRYLGLDGRPVYALISKVSSETYRKVDSSNEIVGFTYVGDKGGSWSFVPAYRGMSYKFDANLYQWVQNKALSTDATMSVAGVHNYNQDMGIGTRVRFHTVANLGEAKVTEFKLVNRDLFKKDVLEINEKKLEDYKVQVIVKTLPELEVADIENADLIYFNDGGEKDSYRYQTVVELYKKYKSLNDTWEPSVKHLGIEGNSNYYSSNLNSVMNALYSYVTLGCAPDDIHYDNGMAKVNDARKPVIIFDSAFYDYAREEYGTTGSNLETVSSIDKYSLTYTGKSGESKDKYKIFTTERPEYLYKNALTKLYIVTNMMYPQVFFKHYIEHGNEIDTIDISQVKLPNIEVAGSDTVSNWNSSLLMPVDIYDNYGNTEAYRQMGLDNVYLTEKYVAEHNVFSFDSNRDNTIFYNFSNNVIPRLNTTIEAFDGLKINSDSKSQITVAEALNYLIKHQTVNIVKQSTMNILELEPSNSFIASEGWSWRLSGLAPYYLGNPADFDGLTNQMPMRQFVGVNKDLLDNYDLIYIGDKVGDVPYEWATKDTGLSNPNLILQSDERVVLSADWFCRYDAPYGLLLTTRNDVSTSSGQSNNVDWILENNTLTVKANKASGSTDNDTFEIQLKLRVYTNKEKGAWKSNNISLKGMVVTSATEELRINGEETNAAGIDNNITAKSVKLPNGNMMSTKINDALPSGEYAIVSNNRYLYMDTEGNLKMRDKDGFEYTAEGSINSKYIFVWDKEAKKLTHKNTGKVVSGVEVIEGFRDNGTLWYMGSKKLHCNEIEHVHTAKPTRVPSYNGETDGCWTANLDYGWAFTCDKDDSWIHTHTIKPTLTGNVTATTPDGVDLKSGCWIPVVSSYTSSSSFMPLPEISSDLEIATSVDELGGMPFILSVRKNNSENTYYFLNYITDNKIAKTSPNDLYTSALWTFEKVPGTTNKFNLSTVDSNGTKKYMNMSTTGAMSLDTVNKTDFVVTLYPGKTDRFYIYYEVGTTKYGLNMSNGENGKGFGGWANKNDGSMIKLSYAATLPDDPYGIDGGSFYLVNYRTGTSGALLTSTVHSNGNLTAKAVSISNGNSIEATDELTKWTFESIKGASYYVTTVVNGVKKYLQVNGTSIYVVDIPDSNCELTAVRGKGTFNGKIRIGNSAGYSPNLHGGNISRGFGGWNDNKENEWFSLAIAGDADSYYINITDWKLDCGYDYIHVHDNEPTYIPSVNEELSVPNGCFKAWLDYSWYLSSGVNSCLGYEHKHGFDCHDYKLMHLEDRTVLSLIDVSAPDKYTNTLNDSILWNIQPVSDTQAGAVSGAYFNYHKAFNSSDVVESYNGELINGMVVDFSKWINPAGTYNVSYRVDDISKNSNYTYDPTVDPNKLYIKSKNVTNNTLYKFDVIVSYKATDVATAATKYMRVRLYVREFPDMEKAKVDFISTVYNDTDMNGLRYYHTGDYNIIKVSNQSYVASSDGALQKDKTSDLLNGRLHFASEPSTLSSFSPYSFYTRMSGNDITKKKMKEMQTFVDASMPIIVADSLVVLDEYGRIKQPDADKIDNSSYLYEFINTNKANLLYETQVVSNVWDTAFTKNISIIVDDEGLPTIYDASEEGGGITDDDYLADRKLHYAFRLESANNSSDRYTCRLYIDSNADGIFDTEKEELKNISVTRAGGRVEANSLMAGNSYVVDKIVPEEYFGSIYWKLEITKNSDASIHDSLIGISAVKTPEESRPTILALQLTPTLVGSKYLESFLYIDSTRQRYNQLNNSGKKLFGYLDGVQDFNIYSMSATPYKLLTTGNAETGEVAGEVKKIFAYKVTTRLYTDPSCEEQYQVKGKLQTDTNFVYYVNTNGNPTDKPMTSKLQFETGITMISEDEAKATGEDYSKFLGENNVLIRPYTGTFTASDTASESYNGTQTLYVYRYIQGVGFNEIYDYDETDDIPVGESPEVVGIDMLILGFQDWMYYTDNDNLIAAIREHIEAGKTVLMGHDTLYYEATDNQEVANRWGGNPSDYARLRIGRYKMYYALKDLFCVDKYGEDKDGNPWTLPWKPKSGRNILLSEEAQGWSDTTANNKANQDSSASYYVPFAKNRVQTGDKNYYCTKVDLVNRGQITEYPYYLPDSFNVSQTHAQYWQLNTEDDVAVWMTLQHGNNGPSSNFDKDTVNGYYIYSKGNILYSGVGHSGNFTDYELKLFVNSIISSYRSELAGATLLVNNYDANTYGADTYIYIDSDFEEASEAVEDTDFGEQKLKFTVVENNLVSNPTIKVAFAEPIEENDRQVTVRNFDEKTKSIFGDEDEDAAFNIKLYRYTDNIDEAELVSSDDAEENEVASNYNYYLVIPDDIIRWYSQKLADGNKNSYVLYAKLTFSYKVGLEIEGAQKERTVETLQRIIFVKRDLFLMG